MRLLSTITMAAALANGAKGGLRVVALRTIIMSCLSLCLSPSCPRLCHSPFQQAALLSPAAAAAHRARRDARYV
jgi:hypothetical protein